MQGLRVRILNPVAEFIREESFSGFVLMGIAVIACLWANLASQSYQDFIHWPMPFRLTDHELSLQHFINDVLMSVFFLVMGHEIKRELVIGELSDLRRALLPIVAAAGGMVVPALVYAIFASSHPTASHGWGIPMATDIAFALGALSLLGSRIPSGLKVFLLALAVVDDLGAVLVIAFFYTPHLTLTPLFTALLIYLVIWGFLRFSKMPRLLFFLLGIGAWWAILKSGVHATIGGVILGLLAPVDDGTQAHGIMPEMKVLHHLIAFGIMPVFALTNAGVELGNLTFSTPPEQAVFWGVLLGLFIGKPVGVLITSLAAVRLKWADLPQQVSWRQMAGVGMLAGIGFTMALFVSSLSFRSDLLNGTAKIAILSASLLSAVGGILMLALQKARKEG